MEAKNIFRSNTPRMIHLYIMNLLFFLVLGSGLLTNSVNAQTQGYWKFISAEVEPRDASYDGKMGIAGDFGNMLFTHTAPNAISKTDGPPWREDQTVSARFVWEQPADILVAGEIMKFTYSCMVTVNSHPDQGMSMGGSAVAWFGWNYGQNVTFRHEYDPEKFILSYATYANSGSANNLNINKGEMYLYGQFEVPVAQNNYREENNRKITAITFKINAGTASPFTYRYLYEWHDGPVPTTSVSKTGLPNPLAGKWYLGNTGDYWTFSPMGDDKYLATKSGKSKDSGLAILEGNQLILIFITEDRSMSGIYSMQLSEDKTTISGIWMNAMVIGDTIEMKKGK